MFNEFAKYEEGFQVLLRDGLPGLKPDSYKYIESLTSSDDNQAPQRNTLAAPMGSIPAHCVYTRDSGQERHWRGRAITQHCDWRRQDRSNRGADRLAAHCARR